MGVHHATAGRMSRRKYRASKRKSLGAGQTRRRKNGNMKKTWEKRRIRSHDKEKGVITCTL